MKMRSSSANWLFGLAALLATVLVVALALELRATRSGYGDLLARSRVVQPGAYLPRLELGLLDGDSVVLGEESSGSCQLLLVYNTRCGFCRMTIPEWQALARRAHATGAVKVYGVSPDSVETTRAYSRLHALSFPTALLPDERSRSLLRSGIVPQTLLVAASGQVLWSRPGVLSPAAADSVWNRVQQPPAAGPACSSAEHSQAQEPR